jgi:hypothetical protein
VPVCPLTAFVSWSARRWLVAIATAAVTFLLLGASTAVIPNPVFGRSVPPTAWALEVLVATAVLTGLLTATYVSTGRQEGLDRRGTVGALLAYFAIGCPVCNKLVLIALGTTGALQFFAPVQPYLAVAGLAVLAWALMVRLRGEMTCSITLPGEDREESGSSDLIAESPGKWASGFDGDHRGGDTAQVDGSAGCGGGSGGRTP